MSTQPQRPAANVRTRVVIGGVLALAALTAVGCSRNEMNDPYVSRGARTIRIEVMNLNYLDATLHAIRGGQRQRLGIVIGKTDATYTLDWTQSLPLQIEIDLLASGSCTTRPLQVDPGDVIELQIETRLSLDPDCIPTRDR